MRQHIPMTIGRGVDRATGLAGVSPQMPIDVRNVFAKDQKMAVRPGLSGTGYPPLTWGTDLLCVQPIKATGDVLFCVYDRVSYQIRIFRLYVAGITVQTVATVWGTINGAAEFPIVTADEANGFVFFAHNEANINYRLPTVFYTPNFINPSAVGTLSTLSQDLNGSGTPNPVYFRSVKAYLVYMGGTGYGSVDDPDRGDILRLCAPTDPMTWPPENYFAVGVQKDPIIGLVEAVGMPMTNAVAQGSILAIAKEDQSYQLVGSSPDDFGIFSLDARYGAVSARCLVNIGGKAFMWSSDGAREITPTGTVPIAQPLELTSPYPNDFPALGAGRNCFVAYDLPTKRLTWCFPDLKNGQNPVAGFTLSLWNVSDPRWTFDVINQPVSCAGYRIFSDPGGAAAPPPVGYASGVTAVDAGIALLSAYRNVTVSWTNNNQTGFETVQILARPTGGSYAVAATVGVSGLPTQSTSWTLALPITSYDIAIRYLNSTTPAVGYDSMDASTWTASTAAGSKTTVTTLVANVAWVSGVFTNSSTPVLLTWSDGNTGLTYLLEKSLDAGVTYTTVASGIIATSLFYAVPPAELGTTVRFRITPVNGANSGTPATLDVLMAIVIGTPTWVSGTYNATTGVATLTWNAASNALTYLLEKSNDGGTTWTTVATQPGTTYNYSVPGGEVNTTVDFRVTGQNGGTSGTPSTTQAVSMTFSVGAGVMIGTVWTPHSVPPNYGSVAVSWAAASNANQYILERQVNGGGYSTITTTSSLSYTDSDFPVGNLNVTVDYRVTPRSSTYSMNGATSAPRSVTTTFAVGGGVMSGAAWTPFTTSLGALPNFGKIVVSWAAASNAAQYTLERQVNGGGYTTITTTGSTTYTDFVPPASLNVSVDYRVTPTAGPMSGATSAPRSVSTTYTPSETITAASCVRSGGSSIYAVSISPDASGYMLVKGGASDFFVSFNSGVGVSGPAITPGTSLLFYAEHTNSGGNYWSLPFAVVAS